MPILLILLLTLACLPESWPRPGEWIVSPTQSIALTWLLVGLEIGFASIIAGRTRHHVERHSLPKATILRRYLRGRKLHQLALIGIYLFALYGLGYGWGLHQSWANDKGLLPGVDVLLLAPFIAALLLSWAAFYSAERAMHDAEEGVTDDELTVGRWSYVFFHARQNLALVLLPVSMLLIEKELRRSIPAWETMWQEYGNGLGIILAMIIFFSMPLLLRWVLGLTPLEQGALRARLEATSQRLGFRCSNILVWHTRGGVANAMIVGVLPFLRYVLLSDRLIEDLTEDEIEAVFGHEIGHVKHHHMLLYLVFLFTSIIVFSLALQPVLPYLDEWFAFSGRQDLAALPVVIALGAYIFLIFGFLSRRCERQADIYGCRAVSCSELFCQGHTEGQPLAPRGKGLCAAGIRTFCSALEKVAILNGVSREKPGFFQSWQHSTIARRVEFLQQLVMEPQTEQHFQRRVLLLKWTLFVLLGSVLMFDLFR